MSEGRKGRTCQVCLLLFPKDDQRKVYRDVSQVKNHAAIHAEQDGTPLLDTLRICFPIPAAKINPGDAELLNHINNPEAAEKGTESNRDEAIIITNDEDQTVRRDEGIGLKVGIGMFSRCFPTVPIPIPRLVVPNDHNSSDNSIRELGNDGSKEEKAEEGRRSSPETSETTTTADVVVADPYEDDMTTYIKYLTQKRKLAVIFSWKDKVKCEYPDCSFFGPFTTESMLDRHLESHLPEQGSAAGFETLCYICWQTGRSPHRFQKINSHFTVSHKGVTRTPSLYMEMKHSVAKPLLAILNSAVPDQRQLIRSFDASKHKNPPKNSRSLMKTAVDKPAHESVPIEQLSEKSAAHPTTPSSAGQMETENDLSKSSRLKSNQQPAGEKAGEKAPPKTNLIVVQQQTRKRSIQTAPPQGKVNKRKVQ